MTNKRSQNDFYCYSMTFWVNGKKRKYKDVERELAKARAKKTAWDFEKRKEKSQKEKRVWPSGVPWEGLENEVFVKKKWNRKIRTDLG